MGFFGGDGVELELGDLIGEYCVREFVSYGVE